MESRLSIDRATCEEMLNMSKTWKCANQRLELFMLHQKLSSYGKIASRALDNDDIDVAAKTIEHSAEHIRRTTALFDKTCINPNVLERCRRQDGLSFQQEKPNPINNFAKKSTNSFLKKWNIF